MKREEVKLSRLLFQELWLHTEKDGVRAKGIYPRTSGAAPDHRRHPRDIATDCPEGVGIPSLPWGH